MVPLNDEEIMRVHRACVARLPQLLKSSNCKFGGHASRNDIALTQKQLRIKLPYELVQILLVSNGVVGPAGEPWLWSIEKILAENMSMRSDPALGETHMPVSNLLFFGGQGNGNLYGYSIYRKACGFLFEWKHESDDRKRRALCLDDFFTRLIETNAWRPRFPEFAQAQASTSQKGFLPDLGESCKFGLPAADDNIRFAEGALGISFGRELRELYKVADGIEHKNGRVLLYSLDRLTAENLSMRRDDLRELYMPFEPLLFFGAEGNGDLYAFRILKGKIDQRVFEWNHESDDRVSISETLPGFYEYLQECNQI